MLTRRDLQETEILMWLRKNWPLLLSMLLLAFIIYYIDLAALWRTFQRISVWKFAIALALSLINYLLRSWRWQLYSHNFGIDIAFWLNAKIYVAGFAFALTPAKAGETVRALYLRRLGIPYERSLAMLLADRVHDLLGIMLLAAFFSKIMVLVAILVMLIVFLLGHVIWQFHPEGSKVVVNLLKSLHNAKVFWQPLWLLQGISLALVSWSLEGLGLWLLLDAVGAELDILTTWGIYGMSVLVGALSFLPGGLGGTESTMLALLSGLSLTQDQASAAIFLSRAATLWFGLLMGSLVVAILGKVNSQEKST